MPNRGFHCLRSAIVPGEYGPGGGPVVGGVSRALGNTGVAGVAESVVG